MNFLPKGRLDAFADGVFAIVITLLVLDLAVPEASVNVITGLMQEWPVFLAYLISFAFIGSAWITHSSVTHLIKRETSHSYRLTLLMLFFVSLLPFTTKLMSLHLGNAPTDLLAISGLGLLDFSVTVNAIMRSAIGTPVTIYGLNLLAATLTVIAIIKSALITPETLVDESAENELNALLRRQQLGAVIIGCTLIFAVFFPLIAVFGYVGVSVLFFITPTIATAKATLKNK
jgi:TMEM175 potassium channel family protein